MYVISRIYFILADSALGSDDRLPRKALLEIVIFSMQRYNQHYKIIKDCLMDLCRGLAPNISSEELSALLKGTIVPEVSVRTAVLQAIDSELDLDDLKFSEEIWLACHDDVEENVELAQTIWEDNDLELNSGVATQITPYLDSLDKQLRRAAARSLGETVSRFPHIFDELLRILQESYTEK